MSLSRASTRRPVAVAMFFLAVVLLGGISYARLPIDLLPDVSFPRLVIYTSYADVAPAEVERLVSEPIEAAAAAVPGVERITSVSRHGISLVTLRMAWGTDMDFAMLNTRERLDNIRESLPESASRPRILRVDPESEPVMLVSVSGGADLWETKDLAETVFRRRLEQLDGVAEAAVSGGLDREIHVEIDPELLESYDLELDEVINARDRSNYSAPGGTILRGRYRYPLRTLGEFQTVAEIAEVVVGRQRLGGEETDGGQEAYRLVRLSDVARIEDGFRERETLARYNGSEGVGILVFKEPGANTVAVAEDVRGVLTQLSGEYPSVATEVAYSQAGFIADSIDNVVQALVLGGMLAFLVLFLFLRDPRYPVTVALAIPISVVGTFALMDAFGVSLNIMSLGGLALGVGMLVDNSIVVLENVFRHRESGAPAAEAAAKGAEEVRGAITASTLTTISVFGPIVYVEGVAGELFQDLSLAVTFSLLASLLVALTLLPTLAARFAGQNPDPASELDGAVSDGAGQSGAPPGVRHGPAARFLGSTRRLVGGPAWLVRTGRGLVVQLLGFWGDSLRSVARWAFGPFLSWFDGAFQRFADRYHDALEWSLDHRARVLGFSAAALAGTVALMLTLDRDLLPSVDQGSFTVRLELPEGTSLEATARTAGEIEDALLSDSLVAAVFSTVGQDVRAYAEGEESSGLHTAEIQVRLDGGVRTDEALDRLRFLADRYPTGTVSFETGQATALGQMLGGAEADVAVRIRGEDLTAAFGYAEAVRDRLGSVSVLGNVRLGSERGQPEVQARIRRDVAARHEIEPALIAETLQRSMRGYAATEFVDFDRKIDIVVRLPDDRRHSLETLSTLRVQGVPMRELVEIREAVGPAEIRREDQGRVVVVYADVIRGGLDGAIGLIQGALRELPPPAERQLRVEVGGENEEMRRSFRDLAFAFGLALILVFMILAAQFESFLHPLTILISVPLALVGAVLALALTGQGLNTMSLIGIVILVGIVVNDAIVKVDFINQARTSGRELHAAILEAGRVRLRPIVMTTVTTILGLTPMALGIGRGADLRAPLAIAVIGGLAVATLLTLVVVPVVYSSLEGLRGVDVPTAAPDVAGTVSGALTPGSGD
jgi:HAE1 family hydrophobic/amphiphilic exporter-1